MESQFKPLIMKNTNTFLKKSDAIVEFTYYANNYQYDFIDQVWKDNTMLKNHLNDKWDTLVTQLTKAREECSNPLVRSMSGTELFYRFYMMLDYGNKEKLNQFILNNKN